MFKKFLIILLTLEFFFRISLQGQSVVAVHAVVVLTPPYSLSLSDYGSAGSDRMTINLWTTGFEATDIQLRITIQGNGFKLVTRGSYMPPVINLQPGITEILSGIDISGYFDPSNLDFIGIDKQSYLRTNKLPEGYYTFNVDVYNYPRGNKVSGGTAAAYIVLNDPPVINTPENNSKPRANDPQNIVFSWSPRHMGSPNSAFTTEYEIKIVEIWPKGRDPYEAMRTSPSIYETTTQNTSFIYDMMCPLLTPGNEYAFNIRAKAIKGIEQLDLFRNDGYSETFKFTFGDECKPPTGFDAKPVNGGGLEVKWKTGLSHTGYNIRYRVKGSDKDWWTDQSMVDNIRIYQLPGNTDIEYEVDAECGTLESQYSETQYAHTAAIEQKPFECKNASPPAAITNNNDQPELAPGAEINAGGFKARITQVVRNSDGSFSGECVVTIPFFNYAKIVHTFDHIRVNTEGQLFQGKLISKVDTTGTYMVKLGPTHRNPPDNNNDTTEISQSNVKDTLVVNDTIKTVYTDSIGNTVIITTDGDTITKKINEPTLITDANGDKYIVNPNGDITQPGVTTTSSDTTAAKAKNPITVTFYSSNDQQYGFDQLNPDQVYKILDDPQYYPRETINGSNYYVPWKSISAGSSDKVKVKISKAKNDTTKTRLVFTDGNGNILKLQDSTLVLNGSGEGTQEISAKYTESDTSKKTFTAGKLGLVSYSDINNPTNVIIVPVGAQVNSYSTGALQTALNKIYKQANKTFSVSSISSVSYSNQSFDANPPDAVSYTDDMVDLINTLQDAIGDNCAANNYYLFLLDHCNDGKDGIMPFNQNFGFIFTAHQSGEVLNRTIAHELGHGAFGLLHTFHTYKYEKQLDSAMTDNLMDYAGGIRLFKYQWDEIHYPVFYNETTFGTGTTGGDVASIGMKNIAIAAKEGNAEWNNSITCLTSAGIPFTLPDDVKTLSFVGVQGIPNGVLTGFSTSQERYLGLFDAVSNNFLGYGKYINPNAENIPDRFEKNNGKISYYLDTKTPNSIVYLGIRSNCEITIKTIPLDLLSVKTNDKKTGEGSIKPVVIADYIAKSTNTLNPIRDNAACLGEYGQDYYLEREKDAVIDKDQLLRIAILIDVIGSHLYDQYSTQAKELDKSSVNSYWSRENWEGTKEGYDLFEETLNKYINDYNAYISLINKCDDPRKVTLMTALLTIGQLKSLGMDTRMHILNAMIKAPMKGVLLGGYDGEYVALNLIKTIKNNEISVLLDKLKENYLLNDLIYRIDGDNFNELVFTLTDYINRILTKPSEEQLISNDRAFRWNRKVISTKKIKYHSYNSGNYSNLLKTDPQEKFKITYEIPQYDNSELFLTNLDPYEFIDLAIESDLPYLNINADEQKRIIIPAILFHWILNEQDNDANMNKLKIALAGTFLIYSVGEMAVTSGWEFWFAATGFTVTSAEVFKDASGFADDPDYQSFNKWIDRINEVYGLAYIVKLGIDRYIDEARAASKFWKANESLSSLDAAGKAEINRIIEETDKELVRIANVTETGNNLPSVIRQLLSKPSYKPLRIVVSKQNKTITFIGKWDEIVGGQQNGLQKVFNELSETDLNIYMLSGKFDHPGGFNMLSIDNFSAKQAEYVQKLNAGQINSSWSFDEYIWEFYNKPWLESALQRGDDIVIWSDPIISRTGFYKRELDFIQAKASQYGYDYNAGISSGTFKK